MSDLTSKILLVALIIVFSPFAYIWGFLIVRLPKKYGYFKFGVILLCYILVIALSTLLLTKGAIGLVIFFLIPNLLLLLGIFPLKDEFKTTLKETFRRVNEKVRNKD